MISTSTGCRVVQWVIAAGIPRIRRSTRGNQLLRTIKVIRYTAHVQCRESISILHIQTCPCAYESGSGSGTAMAGSSVKRGRPCMVYGIRICAPPPMSLQQGTYTLVAVGEQYVSHVGTVCTEMKRCLAVALVKRGGGGERYQGFCCVHV